MARQSTKNLITYALQVSLFHDRDKLGSYKLVNEKTNVTVQSGVVLGRSDNSAAKAHNNPNRDSLKPFGDTPTGVWIGTLFAASTNTHAYGPNRRLLLAPVSGNAKAASTRSGIMCHGGDLNPSYKQWDGLRPTDGCLRFHDVEIKAITDFVLAAGTTVNVFVTEIG
jgi:hypothetical protein